MNIGLIDVDSHGFPNLALMKLVPLGTSYKVIPWSGIIHSIIMIKFTWLKYSTLQKIIDNG